MKVELFLVTKQGKFQITNILGISEELIVYSDVRGTLFFARTQDLRIGGLEDLPDAIFQMLDMDDIEVTVNDNTIFNSAISGWRPDMVERVANEIIPLG